MTLNPETLEVEEYKSLRSAFAHLNGQRLQ